MKALESAEIDRMAERLSEWKRFQRTDTGRIVANLADPMIEYLTGLLSRGAAECGMSLDILNEYRAEIRGELKWWKGIKETPKRLEERLKQFSQLKKQEAGEGEEGGEADKKVDPAIGKHM